MKFDKRHGGPYDRGGADSYYGRAYNPHYYKGATSFSELVTMAHMTPAELEAYDAGFNDNERNGYFKDW
jgi:hypothetical protein